jgi:hypothetical protein
MTLNRITVVILVLPCGVFAPDSKVLVLMEVDRVFDQLSELLCGEVMSYNFPSIDLAERTNL